MKNKYILFLFTSILVVAFFFSFIQQESEAKKILNEVSEKYKKHKHIEIDFTFTLENLEIDIKETQKGTLKSAVDENKYVILLEDTEIYCNGKTKWVYLAEDDEVQISNLDLSDEDMLSPSKLLNIYEKGYKYIYLEDGVVNKKKAHIIELIPIKKNNIFKVKIWVNKNTKIIEQLRFYENTGNRYTYTINNFKGNKKYAPESFIFDISKHPDAYIEDLRE